MKVLIISNLFPNRLEKNRATFNRHQFKELSNRCSIKIVAQVAWTSRVLLKKATGQNIPYKEIIDGIETFHPTYFFTPKVFGSLYGFFCFLSIYSTVARLLKLMRSDCILATWAYPDGFAAVLFGRLYSIPVFIKVHGSDIHGVKSGFRKTLTTWGLKKARKVFSVSNDLKRKMVDMGVDNDRIITVYNGLDRRLFSPWEKLDARKKFNIPLEKKVMLFVGNLELVKGPDILINAYKKVKLDKSNHILYVAGKGSLLKDLKEQCVAFGIEKSVIFLGQVSYEMMGVCLNAADLLIVPSRNEGVPNVILEAMACGIPVVATNVGGISEVVVENLTGLLVEPGDTDKLAEAIEQSLNKKWNKEAIIKESENYTWEKNVSTIIKHMNMDINHESP